MKHQPHQPQHQANCVTPLPSFPHSGLTSLGKQEASGGSLDWDLAQSFETGDSSLSASPGTPRKADFSSRAQIRSNRTPGIPP